MPAVEAPSFAAVAVAQVKAPIKARPRTSVSVKQYPGGPAGLRMGYIESWVGDESSGPDPTIRRVTAEIPDPYDPANRPKPQGPDPSL